MIWSEAQGYGQSGESGPEMEQALVVIIRLVKEPTNASVSSGRKHMPHICKTQAKKKISFIIPVRRNESIYS
jgi:hypothetical protein